MNEIVWSTETVQQRRIPAPLPVNARTCRSCGSDERIVNRGRKTGFGWVVFLQCGHFQNDDEY